MKLTKKQLQMVERRIVKAPQRRLDEYTAYWRGLYPQGHKEIYARWLFAWCSVHQSWQNNVRLFQAAIALPLTVSFSAFDEQLRAARAGFTQRHRDLYAFREAFWTSPQSFLVAHDEPLLLARSRLFEEIRRHKLRGLGLAKLSFFLELARPLSCEVVCIDRHVARWYGLDATRHLAPAEYCRLEEHWVESCREKRRASPIVRHVLWDLQKGQSATTYWSSVFHDC